MAVIGVIDNYISRIAEYLSIWQFLMVRAVFAIPLVGLLSYFGVGRLRPIRLWAVFMRSFLIAVAMLFYFSSLSLLSMTQGACWAFYVACFCPFDHCPSSAAPHRTYSDYGCRNWICGDCSRS